MIHPSKKAGVFSLNVDMLNPLDIGKIITISAVDHESDDDGSTYESSGKLYTLQRCFDSNGDFRNLTIKLGGPDATIRNGMMFVLDKDEVESGDYKFAYITSTRD